MLEMNLHHWIPFPSGLQPENTKPSRGRPRSKVLEGFLVGPENRLAETAIQWVLEGVPSDHDMIERVPIQNVPYMSPLVFYGPSGTGKTHLVRGVYEEYRRRYPRETGICLTATDFHRGLTNALEQNKTTEFRDLFARSRMIVLEDIDTLESYPATQEELLNILEDCRQRESLLILTMLRFPTELTELTSALTSRMIGGLIVPVAFPGESTRRILIDRIAKSCQLSLQEPAMNVLVRDLPPGVGSLYGSIQQLAIQMNGSKTITPKQIRLLLDHRGLNIKRDLGDIAKRVAKFYSVRLTDMRSKSRLKTVALSRNVTIYLARKLTDMTLQELGRWFANRDHTTILHGCVEIESRLETDQELRLAVQQLMNDLVGNDPSSEPPSDENQSIFRS